MADVLVQPLTHRFSEALTFAAEIHRHQPRKGTQIPYVSHVIGVASIALDYGADEDEGIAALLHDAIEDAPDSLGPGKVAVVRERILNAFGTRVLNIVEECTDADVTPKPAWRKRKEDYIAHIADASASVTLVGSSDKLHNARAVLKDFHVGGVSIFDRFDREAGVAGTIGYYCGLSAAFQLRAPQLADARLGPLIAELARTVSAIEHEIGIVGVWPLPSA